MIERGVLSRTVKLQLVVSKNAVEQRKATTTIFKCVLRSAVAIKQFMRRLLAKNQSYLN
ncbi:MAG: hypothetical protein WCB47_12655 [Pseudolabrys sp.]